MAIVTLIGKRYSDFKSKEGNNVQGLKLYYVCTDDNVEGLISCDVWIDQKNSLYGPVDRLDLSQPIEADLSFEVQPSSKRVKLTKVDPLALADPLVNKTAEGA